MDNSSFKAACYSNEPHQATAMKSSDLDLVDVRSNNFEDIRKHCLNNHENMGDSNKALIFLSDLGHNDSRSNKNSHFNSNRSSFSNFNREKGWRNSINEALSYWERGESSGMGADNKAT